MRGNGVRVLVVGAGIAGLAAARTLRTWGAEVEIVERSAAARVEGAGIYLPGNAVRALGDLGLGAQAAARAVRIERQRVGDHRGRPLMDLAVSDLWHGVGPCLAMHRADLHEVLLAGAKEVPIRWGVTIESVVDTGEDVRVTFADGTSQGYDLVLGADGVHSTVRRLIFGAAASARQVGQYAWRFLARWPDSGPVWSVMVGRGGAFLTIPIGDGLVYVYCDGPLDGPRVEPRELLAGFAEPAATVLAAARDGLQGGPVEEVSLPRWSRGLTLLIGDAAHATSPNMAEGAAMAVEDALVLADCLAAAGTITGALRAFEERRRPRTEWVRAQTHRRDRSRSLPTPLRNLVLGRLGEKLFHSSYAPLRKRP
ncbi:FAD-dependent monooxygenase [Phytohabitans houttuyneae]|uniref:2-heptyl-3-hydroxy-4(1H)-quinolone synthase n=1 Tax=Phytohabitans houttuyneae TaxID=1076126 RepID=A0A6V8JU53_9ACTN|nr:FAD-dependent monooxygenase [Phytohabitans houttuyneae]GFJ76103.1 2-heptyl-3-hydroxy-4(1H)-quinolone synthase [Phytohabitans houttuyneae]